MRIPIVPALFATGTHWQASAAACRRKTTATIPKRPCAHDRVAFLDVHRGLGRSKPRFLRRRGVRKGTPAAEMWTWWIPPSPPHKHCPCNPRQPSSTPYPPPTPPPLFHAQALRHLYTLAAVPSMLETRDVDTGMPCYLPVQVHLKKGATLASDSAVSRRVSGPVASGKTRLSMGDANVRANQLLFTPGGGRSTDRLSATGTPVLDRTAPCLMPPLEAVAKVVVKSPRYFPLFLETDNELHLQALLRGFTIFVKRCPGRAPPPRLGPTCPGRVPNQKALRPPNARRTGGRRRRGPVSRRDPPPLPPLGMHWKGRDLSGGPEAVGQAVGGGCQSDWGRLLSVANAMDAGTWRQGDSGWA